MIATWMVAAALAGAPELMVVGIHAPGVGNAEAEDAARRIAAALDATGKVDALAPDEVSARIAGREALILDSFALGPGRDALREGRILYDRAQPDQAIPVLEGAARQLSSGLAVSSDVRDLHEALTLLGLANLGLGNEAAARAALRRTAVLDPSRQLDAVNYPPRVVALYAEVRAAAQAEAPGTLSIAAPPGATVWVDGRRAPTGDISVIPGEHFVLVRAENGASRFEDVQVGAGGRVAVSSELLPRAVARPAGDTAGRSRQTRDLYRSIGQYTDQDPVLLVGVAGGQVALQLYAPISGNFSKALTADGGGDPVGAIVDLLPSAVGFLGENGDIKSDRVSPQVVALDVSTNDVLARMLFSPPKPTADTTVAPARKGAPWYLWAGIGAVVAGGGATAAVLLTQDQGGSTGTITFGPIP